MTRAQANAAAGDRTNPLPNRVDANTSLSATLTLRE